MPEKLHWTVFVNHFDPGRVLTLWRLLHMLRHFNPPFSGLWKICIVSTPIFEQNVVFRPLLFVKMYSFDPPFSSYVAFRVKGRCWASLITTLRYSHISVNMEQSSGQDFQQPEVNFSVRALKFPLIMGLWKKIPGFDKFPAIWGKLCISDVLNVYWPIPFS